SQRLAAKNDAPQHEQRRNEKVAPHEGLDDARGDVREEAGADDTANDPWHEQGEKYLAIEVAEPGLRSAGDSRGGDQCTVNGGTGECRWETQSCEARARDQAVAHADGTIDQLGGEPYCDEPSEFGSHARTSRVP